MRSILTFALFLLVIIPGMAQKKIKVEEERASLGGAKNPVLVVTIYEADEDDIAKGWKSIMKGYGGKVSSKDGAYMADNVVIKDLSNNTNDVYYKIEKVTDTEHKLIVAVNLGGAFMNPTDHATQNTYFKKLMLDFANKTSTDAIGDQLKDAQKALTKMESQETSLEKDQDGLKRDIENYKNKIKTAEDNIKKNEADQAKKKSEIEAQKKVVDVVTKKKAAIN
ncbi:MAG TPA: hypothetical protein VNZ86_05305 [Bacteroidia bacterium]|jgi:hypothetical protein|nr:hypothetical protein [Bacteroidia bacterium]